MRTPSRLEPSSFRVDVLGILAAFTDQFPEPLLCVRELVQNAADAGARRIDTDVAFDAERGLLRISVSDDGRGMSAAEVEAYLTIGSSNKDPLCDRGRFGIGKLSPYALGIAKMVVETSDGLVSHRLDFEGDGSGSLVRHAGRARGSSVRIYKCCTRAEAEVLAQRTFERLQDTCAFIRTPLFCNGVRVNRGASLQTPYAVPVRRSLVQGVIGIVSEPKQLLLSGGIVLERDTPLFGAAVSYILDATSLSPTLSRNAVRRDQALEQVLEAVAAERPRLMEQVAHEFRLRVAARRQASTPVERGLEPNDRAAMEWLRSALLEPESVSSESPLWGTPILETADGELVSVRELVEVIRRERRIPTSRVPRARDELSGYADRGVPVLLLYRDLEDFLERQRIETFEVDGLENAQEVPKSSWGPGEQTLASRARPKRERRAIWSAWAAALVLALSSGTILSREGVDQASVLSDPRKPAALPPAPGTLPGVAMASPVQGAGLETMMESTAGLAQRGRWGVMLAALVAALSGTLGLALLRRTLMTSSPAYVFRSESGTPLAVGDSGPRYWSIVLRALLHPLDFAVARSWSLRLAGARAERVSAPLRSGVRLDLDRLRLGFTELRTSRDEAHDGRVFVRQGERVLLNRNHPTVGQLIRLAAHDGRRARLLLDMLLATDSELARESDPRQAEWDLLNRGERALRSSR